MYEKFYVDKINGTFADNLTASGLAELVKALLFHQERGGKHDVITKDCGTYYLLTCKPHLRRETVEQLDVRLCPVKPIRTVKNAHLFPAGIPFTDYEQDREKSQLRRAAREKKVAQEDLPPLPENWYFTQAINTPTTLKGYNRVAFNWWNLGEGQPDALLLLLDLYATTPNDNDRAIEAWDQLAKERGWNIDAKTTCQQIYNPNQGKGQNNVKADGLRIANMSGFWLTEWLKAWGFYQTAITRLVRDTKDRKTLVIAPRELAQSVSQAVMSKFRNTVTSETSIKFDILAAVNYTLALLEHFSSEESLIQQVLERRNIQKRLVAGFDTAYYKDLGNAAATMNISFIRLPGWVVVDSRDDITLYSEANRGLLPELARLVSRLDELTHLQCLRDFISGDDITKFLQFTTSYAGYYIRQREKGVGAVPISYELVERIVTIMGKTYADIGDKAKYPGFHKIALAISESTVWAQWRKARQNNTTYEIRYGLNQELTRNAHDAERFLEALGKFIHTYNAETSRALELGRKPSREMVDPEDISDVLRMIDDYGNPQMIAQLLVAYGYTFMKSKNEKSSGTEQEKEA